jgi:hypothetical protein
MRTLIAAAEPPRKPTKATVDFIPDPTSDKLVGLLETGTTEQVQGFWGHNISGKQVADLRILFGFGEGAAS